MFLILLVVSLIVLIPLFLKQSQNEEKEIKLKSSFLDFEVKKKHLVKNKEGILIGKDKIAFVTVENDQYKTIGRSYSYKDILEVQAYQNGVMVNSASRNDEGGKALLQATKEVMPEFFTERIPEHKGKKQSTIDLRVVVDDSKFPVHTINFLELEIDEKDMFYRSSMNRATGFFNTIINMIEMSTPKESDESKETEKSEESKQ